MKVQYGPLINYATGSLGVITAKAGFRGQKIMQKKARPHKPSTPEQRLVARYGARANDIWHRLGNAQRTSAQSFLFSFHTAWRNLVRHKKTNPSSEFLAHYVSSAEDVDSASEIEIFPAKPRYPKFDILGMSRTTTTAVTIAARAPKTLPYHVQTSRMLFYWTDDYQYDAERRIHTGNFNYFLTDEVDDSEDITHIFGIGVPATETERTVIVGASMYYFLGIRGLYVVSGSQQYEFTMG